MSSSPQRVASISSHGFPREDLSTTSSSRPVSPPPGTNNPYRSSMAQAIEEAKRLSSIQTKEVPAQDAENMKASSSSIKSSTSDDEFTKDTKRPKTTMFVEPIDEAVLEEKDNHVKTVMEKDVKMKFRIRMAKCFLRCINFGCSLVVLSLVSNSFSIFFATRNIPPRNNLPPWAPQSVLWPAYATLGIACLSLVTAVVVLLSYWRGGHRKAEKAAIWFTAVSIGGFLFMIILWAITAGIITNARNNSGGKDLWAWSCKDNNRKELFSSTIDYDLVCRQMDWSFVCSLIEIIVETLSILLYAAAFWRFAHKSKVRKSMDVRDKARETLYLQKLQEGDMSVYRPEFDAKVEEDGIDLAEQGFSLHRKERTQSYYPPIPVPMYAGAQPIIDPNSGLAINPVTGEASKPHY